MYSIIIRFFLRAGDFKQLEALITFVLYLLMPYKTFNKDVFKERSKNLRGTIYYLSTNSLLLLICTIADSKL